MKFKYLIFVFFFSCELISVQAQSLERDTVICIADTTQSYVAFHENPSKKKNNEYNWFVNIDGHYYDDQPDDADYAGIDLTTAFIDSSWVKGPFVISIPIKNMKNRYTVVTDRWINKQKKLHVLQDKLGFATWHKCNYLVFKQDLDNSINGQVKAYRVSPWYGEVQY